MTLNELVNEALFAWVEMTGVDFTVDRFNDYELRKATEDLNESRSLDETGLTTWMMLRGLTEDYMKEVAFSAYDIVFDSQRIRDRLASMTKLHSHLENPEVVELIDTFIKKVRDTAKRFEFKDTEGMETLLADKYRLSWIRRDALRSLDRLHAHQFTQGEGDKLPIGMNPYVHEVWNVNSLIRILRGQSIPGISVVLVRDPLVLHSFFVLAVKNGDNITILTDKDEEAHPASKRMSRRPDRQLLRRAEQHWFPYGLLDLETSEDGKHLYANARTQLVPINMEAVKLAHVGELTPAEFIWLMLIAEVIREKYWKQNYHVKELSYTGDMVTEPYSLVGETSALVRKNLYKPIELDPLSPADVTSESTRHQWHYSPTYFHSWMVDRYNDQVPRELFNVVGENSAKLIESTTGLGAECKSLITDRFPEYHFEIEYLDTQNFGSKEKLVNDRQWAARVNQMSAIQQLAKKEYEETRAELVGWYQVKIRARSDFFVNAAARGSLIGPNVILADQTGNKVSSIFDPSSMKIEEQNLLYSQVDSKNFIGRTKYDHIMISNHYKGDAVLTDYNRYDGGYPCYDRPETNANIFTVFKPNCPEALAFFLGMSLEELPWQLQYWYADGLEPYGGNNILNRCDPIDWVLDNPWSKLTFRVGVPLSKRAYNARRKTLGLERNQIPVPE